VNRGRHAAADGSFERSAGGAMLRGALLLAVAVLLGVVLLNTFDTGKDPFAEGLVAADRQTTTTPPPEEAEPTTTTSAPPPPTSAPLRAPAQVRVLPLNGTTVNGLGARLADQLKQAGFNVLAADDASRKPVATSAVYSTPGFEAEARDIASRLGLQPNAVQAGTPPASQQALRGANVIVVAGTDLSTRLGTTTARP
jgi:hypothetical protein